MCMRIIKGRRRLLNIRKRFLQWKRSAPYEDIAQCSPGKVRHHKVGDSFMFTVVINGRDVEMLKSCDKARFALEADEELFVQPVVHRDIWQEYFHGDMACKLELLCQEDSTHTPFSNKGLKPIRPQYFSNEVTIEYLHSPLLLELKCRNTSFFPSQYVRRALS